MTKSKELLILLSTCLLCKIAVSSAAVTCQDTGKGRTCSLQSTVEALTIAADQLIVGCSNSLYSLDLDLQTSHYVELSPEASTFEHCKSFDGLGNDPSKCKNFVKLIQETPGDGMILVCGTNAFKPKCTIHNPSNISSYSYMTGTERDDAGFSPHSGETQIVASLTRSGRFYSGTKFDIYIAPQTIQMARNPLHGDSDFTVKVSTSTEKWLKQLPTFVSLYETERHIYFFLREPALEINQGESVVYSRVVRICKSDNGDSTGEFLTFQKARIYCSSEAEQGSIPYTYDNLQSTFLWKEPDGQQFIYGIFTSPENGPSGSAICKYSFDPNAEGSLTSVFEDGEYLVGEGDPPVWSREPVNTFSCPGEPGPQRTRSNGSNQYQLVYNPVTSMDSQPLHTVLGKRLSKIAIDVIVYNGNTQTILYFSTSEGDIHQLVIEAGGRRQEAVIDQAGSALRHLTIREKSNGTRSLYATTENRVMLILLGDCSRYVDCFACLDSSDAYCGWDRDTKRCVNKISTNVPGLVQSALISGDDITAECGERSTATPPIHCETQTPRTDNGVVTEGEKTCSNCTPNTGGLGSENTSNISIPDLIGATVGAFVVGIPVGGFVCFIFMKLFIKPRQHKHTITRRGRSSQGDSNSVTQVNNNLNDENQQQVQKKDLAMKEPSRYVQTTPIAHTPIPIKPSPLTLDPPPPGNTHKRKNSNDKDLNTYVSPEEDETFSDRDQVPPLRTITAVGTFPRSHRSNGYGHTVNGVQRKRVPGHMIPRGRTDSTTWLRANSESSEPASPMSPLDSPISDV